VLYRKRFWVLEANAVISRKTWSEQMNRQTGSALSVDFDQARQFDPPIGVAVDVRPGIRRLVAPNPSPFTFRGTNTYIVGTGRVAIIDPGPDDHMHAEAIDRAVAGQTVVAVIATHTHRDHSPLARAVAARYDAPTYGFGPHSHVRPALPDEQERLGRSNDVLFNPDVVVEDGDRIEGDDWALTVVHTPGHTTNHICLAHEGTGALFSGDHVMGWSTTVVAPPDGSITDFVASLDKLASRDDRFYLPGHGDELANPAAFVRRLAAHRRQRGEAILDTLKAGERTIPNIVDRIYGRIDPRLSGAAGLTVLSYLEDFVGRGHVTAEGGPGMAGIFQLSS